MSILFLQSKPHEFSYMANCNFPKQNLCSMGFSWVDGAVPLLRTGYLNEIDCNNREPRFQLLNGLWLPSKAWLHSTTTENSTVGFDPVATVLDDTYEAVSNRLWTDTSLERHNFGMVTDLTSKMNRVHYRIHRILIRLSSKRCLSRRKSAHISKPLSS